MAWLLAALRSWPVGPEVLEQIQAMPELEQARAWGWVMRTGELTGTDAGTPASSRAVSSRPAFDRADYVGDFLRGSRHFHAGAGTPEMSNHVKIRPLGVVA